MGDRRRGPRSLATKASLVVALPVVLTAVVVAGVLAITRDETVTESTEVRQVRDQLEESQTVVESLSELSIARLAPSAAAGPRATRLRARAGTAVDQLALTGTEHSRVGELAAAARAHLAAVDVLDPSPTPSQLADVASTTAELFDAADALSDELRIELDGSLERSSEQADQRAALAAFAAIAALLVAWVVTRRFVMRMIHQLGAIEADLDGLAGPVTATVTGADELDRVTRKTSRVASELTAREAELRASLGRLERQVEQREAAERRLQTRVERERAVAALGALATGGAELDEVCSTAVDAAATHLSAEVVIVGDVTGNGLRIIAQQGLLDPRPVLSWPSDDGGTVEATVRTLAPICIGDLAEEQRVPVPPGIRARMRSGLVTPFGPDGPHGGIVIAFGRERDAWGPDDLGFLGAMGVVLDAAMELDRSQSTLRYQALHDPTTGLANRLAATQHLEAELAAGDGSVAVLFADIDRLKVINDSRGHTAGDRLLTAVANRIRDVARPDDLVARFAGDQFVVCSRDLDPDHAVALGTRVVEAMVQPFQLDDVSTAHATVSVGVAVADRHAAGSLQAGDLLRDADVAMRRAKAAGGARVVLFDHAHRLAAVAAAQIEHELHDALERHELVLHLQPELATPDTHPVSAEALLRWHHPERGLLLPGAFLAVAEVSGLIEPIGDWVIDEVCRLATDPDVGLRGLGIWCNVTARQLADPGLAGKVADAVHRWAVPPGSVGIEVTEHALIADPDAAEATLHAIHELGIAIAVDDFGTGYSSLAYLKRFPVDVVKIDQRFVAGLGVDEEDTAIVEAVIGLAHTLGLLAVAEGVETHGQLAELRRLGCDMVQGWMFAPAMPPEELAMWRLANPGDRERSQASDNR